MSYYHAGIVLYLVYRDNCYEISLLRNNPNLLSLYYANSGH